MGKTNQHIISSDPFTISYPEAKVIIKKLRGEKVDAAGRPENISVRLTKEEALAIREYARQCGENVSDLIRKALIREATLADGYGSNDKQYDYSLQFPSGRSLSSREEKKLVEQNCNRIRSILGWTSIKL